VREEVDTTLDPGEDRSMRVEIENPTHASATALFKVVATPVTLGGRAMPLPEGW